MNDFNNELGMTDSCFMYPFCFPNQPVKMSRPAQIAPVNQATGGAIKFAKLWNVVATTNAPSPSTRRACVLQKTQVLIIILVFILEEGYIFFQKKKNSTKELTTCFSAVSVIGSITLREEQYFHCLADKSSEHFKKCNEKLLEEVNKVKHC